MASDLQVQQRVIDALEFEPGVNAAHVGVSVRDGAVLLSGHVDSYHEKWVAAGVARQVKGVKAVAQELEVRLPTDKKVADEEIAARAARLLNWDVAVPHDRIAIKVEHGVVTLSGAVDWYYQRAEAEHDVRKLTGVRSLVNDIVVAPSIRPDDVRAKIRAALERNAEVESKNIDITVSDGQVTLTGRVNAWTEREVAERAAWAVPGVSQVENQIELERP
jgi:osmotically-inducible protein OsmY